MTSSAAIYSINPETHNLCNETPTRLQDCRTDDFNVGHASGNCRLLNAAPIAKLQLSGSGIGHYPAPSVGRRHRGRFSRGMADRSQDEIEKLIQEIRKLLDEGTKRSERQQTVVDELQKCVAKIRKVKPK